MSEEWMNAYAYAMISPDENWLQQVDVGEVRAEAAVVYRIVRDDDVARIVVGRVVDGFFMLMPRNGSAPNRQDRRRTPRSGR
jgi:hypothetical protein